MKKLIFLMLTVALCIGLTACGDNKEEKKEKDKGSGKEVLILTKKSDTGINGRLVFDGENGSPDAKVISVHRTISYMKDYKGGPYADAFDMDSTKKIYEMNKQKVEALKGKASFKDEEKSASIILDIPLNNDSEWKAAETAEILPETYYWRNDPKNPGVKLKDYKHMTVDYVKNFYEKHDWEVEKAPKN